MQYFSTFKNADATNKLIFETRCPVQRCAIEYQKIKRTFQHEEKISNK